ncbi:MAG: class I SAM-dependent methyltransferase [Clostridia bacterium]|nr:class I SAM-dependent methyltransferase [Clostridia bacterium]
MSDHAKEVSEGKRFEFGKNWAQFLSKLNDERILVAEKSLKEMLNVDTLEKKTFIDVGSGSGLFSLCARRLGARVHSFDYDPNSVNCTAELKRRYYNGDAQWTVEEGNALDKGYLESLGKFDIVYSWGVLHHTGNMWRALDNVSSLVAPEGMLFISIYNNQGRASNQWLAVKKLYNKLPGGMKFIVLWPSFIRLRGPMFLRDLFKGKPMYTWNTYIKRRGMSPWSDVVDWVGGYPFEVAKPEEIFDFYRDRGFKLLNMKTCAGGRGCNEFVFKKEN